MKLSSACVKLRKCVRKYSEKCNEEKCEKPKSENEINLLKRKYNEKLQPSWNEKLNVWKLNSLFRRNNVSAEEEEREACSIWRETWRREEKKYQREKMSEIEPKCSEKMTLG